VRDLRLWVSSTKIRLKDEVSGRAGRLRLTSGIGGWGVRILGLGSDMIWNRD
jgi:hypothetical protein